MPPFLDKGKINSFEAETDKNGDAKLARVLPDSTPSSPTRPLVISWHLRGDMGNLAVGDEVWFMVSDDLSGIILERADGEWNSIIPGDVKIDGNVELNDMTSSSVPSYNSHLHVSGKEGSDTSEPK